MPQDQLGTEYINSTDYKKLESKAKVLTNILDDNLKKSADSRKLRYSDVDIEAERESGRIQPDELYIPMHLIDTNIRREQSPYVQYITQSDRAVIIRDSLDDSIDMSMLEKDLTRKIRYDGWQLPQYANIDSFQQHGYAIQELVLDMTTPGELSTEAVQFGDFAFIQDTRDLQSVEMCVRAYYYSKTRLLELCESEDESSRFNKEQVDKVINKEPDSNVNSAESYDVKDRSLYKIMKMMFRVKGIVQVAWICPDTCDDWLRKPRPLYIGMRKPQIQNLLHKAAMLMGGLPPTTEQYETQFPYFLFPYLISENDTISNLKGRVFLDQDMQEAVSSLLSSTVTKARRSAGLYFSKDTSDPNDDILTQKNIFFRSGCIINGKVSEFQLTPPDPSMFGAIQALVTANSNETSQVNFAANNRKDSRKTAEEIRTSTQQSAILSTVQVVLFSIALRQMYGAMVRVIQSRVKAGLIKVDPRIRPLYDRQLIVKPSGDVDVIEKQSLTNLMMQSWPVIQNTPAAVPFLSDLISLMFPQNAPKYIAAFQQQQQQQQSAQGQQMQQMMQQLQQLSASIVSLSKHPEMFSEIGRIHALPAIEGVAQQIEQQQEQIKNQQQAQQQAKQQQLTAPSS